MWEVMSYGERPYWEMSNQDVRLFTARCSVNLSLHTRFINLNSRLHLKTPSIQMKQFHRVIIDNEMS